MMTTFWRHWRQLIFFSAWNLYHICHIANSFYRRMMHEEDERPPNENSHAYHFSITYNGCDFCLLTPSAILALPKCLYKGWRLKFGGFICLRSCSGHCNWIWSALHKDEHKKDVKHKKLLNLLCIVYIIKAQQFYTDLGLLSTELSPTENSRIQGLFKAFEWFSSTFQGRFYFQWLFKKAL